jgi:hypothetical protein
MHSRGNEYKSKNIRTVRRSVLCAVFVSIKYPVCNKSKQLFLQIEISSSRLLNLNLLLLLLLLLLLVERYWDPRYLLKSLGI